MNEASKKDIENLLFNSGLYEKIKLTEIETRDFASNLSSVDKKRPQIKSYDGPEVHDSYCLHCKKESTFKHRNSEAIGINEEVGYFRINFTSGPGGYAKPKPFIGVGLSKTIVYECSRDKNHTLIFNIIITDDGIIKIGQHPSVRDSGFEDISEYKKVLEKIDLEELNMALNLASHGIGIGSFVYLRRVIERLVYKNYNENKEEIVSFNSDMNKNDFNRLKFKDRVKIVSPYLPETFNMASGRIYSILSEGIHELKESECKKYYPVLKELIFIILNDNLTKKKNDIRKENLIKELNLFHSEIKMNREDSANGS